MSRQELTVQRQICYLLEWFQEFSDFQRFDLLNVHLLPVSEKFISSHLLQVQNNGTINNDCKSNGLSANDATRSSEFIRPPSIFECRMKLLSEWTDNWKDNDFMQFFKQLSNVDERFVRQLFRLFLQNKQINSYESFQEKIFAENEFINDFQLNETLFELPIESTKDECFYSMLEDNFQQNQAKFIENDLKCLSEQNKQQNIIEIDNEQMNHDNKENVLHSSLTENIDLFENNLQQDNQQMQQTEIEQRTEVQNENESTES